MSAQTIELAAAALRRHEAIIARGLKTFIEVGNALLAIRSERLYLATHETYDAYCRERWGISYQRAHQITQAAEAVSKILDTGLPTPNESQARELAKVPEPEREQVWRETLDRTDGKPTATAVREVAAPAAEPAPTNPGPSEVDAAIERYPDLEAFASNPNKVLFNAAALDGYDPAERAVRLDALAKHAAAERRRQADPPAPPQPADDRAQRVFDAANQIARILDVADLGDVVAAIDPQVRDLYSAQFDRTIGHLGRLIGAMKSASALRSVKA